MIPLRLVIDTYLRSVERDVELEKCTYAGRPYGDRSFVAEMGNRFRRQWTRGRPKKQRVPGAARFDAAGSLFADGS